MKKIGKASGSKLRKVCAIFRELKGKRSPKGSLRTAIEQAFADQYSHEVTRDIAFHLTDWHCEALFLVALQLFPERFSPLEVKVGVTQFLADAPNHVAAAAKLLDFPVSDVYGIGAIDGLDEPEKPDSTKLSERERFERYEKLRENREEKVQTLLANLKLHKAKLIKLWKNSDHSRYEDSIYRFYHQSSDVFRLQESTVKIVSTLRTLLPKQPLNYWFLQIIAEGTGHKFTLEMNADWPRHTRPIVEAFLHARYMLEMAVRYTGRRAPPETRKSRYPSEDVRRLTDLATHAIPSGWQAFLYLFNLR